VPVAVILIGSMGDGIAPASHPGGRQGLPIMGVGLLPVVIMLMLILGGLL